MNDLNDSAHVSVSQHDQASLHQPRMARMKPKVKAMATNATLAVARTNPGRLAMNGTAEVFQSHRPRLFGVAYRMLGSRAAAEDLLQDAYLRWHQSATKDIRSPVAFLVTITTRLCLDRLRELEQEREQYVGPWLPEPIVDDHVHSPEIQLEIADEVSVAFLAVLERLGPEQRAAFLLHEVFDYDYPEVAQMTGKSEPACRRMVHRVRPLVRESRARFAVTAETRTRLLEKFLAAAGTGDRKAVMALLAEEVQYTPTAVAKALPRIKGNPTIVTGPHHSRSML